LLLRISSFGPIWPYVADEMPKCGKGKGKGKGYGKSKGDNKGNGKGRVNYFIRSKLESLYLI